MKKSELRVIHGLDGSGPFRPIFALDLIESLGVDAGRIYISLIRLEKQGLVASEWFMRKGKARRKMYHLTLAGQLIVEGTEDPGPSWFKRVVNFFQVKPKGA